MFRICIVLAALAWCGVARAERAVLECVADTWVARGDRTPHGSDRTLALTTRGAAALSFRTGAVQGWQLQQVVLLLHLASGRAPLRVKVATIQKPWSENSAMRDSLSTGKAVWKRVRTFDENWIAIDLTPEETDAQGVLLSGVEARFDARETVSFAPYLLVEGASKPGSGSPGGKHGHSGK